MLMRPRKSETEVEAEARDVAWIIKNTVYALQHKIYQKEYQEITLSMKGIKAALGELVGN